MGLNRELARNGDQLAKLTGTYQPERQQVAVTVGRSAAEILAEGKSQLLAVLAERGNGCALPSADTNVDNGIEEIEAIRTRRPGQRNSMASRPPPPTGGHRPVMHGSGPSVPATVQPSIATPFRSTATV